MKQHETDKPGLTDWHSLDWIVILDQTAKIQDEIAKESIIGNRVKVKQLQKSLIESFEGRAIAVRKVTSNKGKSTPGPDGEIWNTPKKKMQAVNALLINLDEYKASPVKRVFIPKPGKREKRPLGIPNMYDRALQALIKLSAEPVTETTSDPHSYGFRPKKSTSDAMAYINILLSNPRGGEWILEADIKGFFDNINHTWIMDNIWYINSNLLKEWLKCGITDKNGIFSETNTGTPQGGVISPLLANAVLDGLEEICINSVQARTYKRIGRDAKGKPKYTQTSSSIHVTRYADDFIVSGKNKEDLKKSVLPAIIKFLDERGLELRWDKTQITHVSEGFDFLGWNFRRYKKMNKERGIFLMHPSKESIKKFNANIKETTNNSINLTQEAFISNLNPIIRGWSNYHSIVSAKKTFSGRSKYVWEKVFSWCKKKHPRRGLRELKGMYFSKRKTRDWIFRARNGTELEEISMVPIRRHILCKDLNPYLLENADYYQKRSKAGSKISCLHSKFGKTILKRSDYLCKVCERPIENFEEYEIHHIIARKDGGTSNPKNLIALHSECHKQVTFTKSKAKRTEFRAKGIIE